MILEDYFNFLAPNDIRIKGTRVGIETVLWDYLEGGLYAEQIARRYPTLSLEQVHATLTYYWHNQTAVTDYLERVERELQQQRQRQDENPPAALLRLRQLTEERHLMADTT